MAAGGAAAIVAVPGIARAARSTGPALPGPTPADWAALAHDLSGQLVRPSQAFYTIARRLFDPRFDSISPAGIVYCTNPHDVATCLAFVRKFGLPMSARSGGHSYAGCSSSTGLIGGRGPMSGGGCRGTTATVGAGPRLIDFYTSLAARGRAVPGGSCPTVGIAGLTLGGGVGVVAREYGLTSATVSRCRSSPRTATSAGGRRARTPTCSGRAMAAAAGTSAWSRRSRSVRAGAADPVHFFLSWPWSQAARVVGAWQSWRRSAGRALVQPAPGGGARRRGAVGPGRRQVPGPPRRRGHPPVPAIRGGGLGPVGAVPESLRPTCPRC